MNESRTSQVTAEENIVTIGGGHVHSLERKSGDW